MRYAGELRKRCMCGFQRSMSLMRTTTRSRQDGLRWVISASTVKQRKYTGSSGLKFYFFTAERLRAAPRGEVGKEDRNGVIEKIEKGKIDLYLSHSC